MKTRRARGYLLIEAMVGAAVITVLLGATISTLASARVSISRASQRTMAAELAQQKVSELTTREGPEEGDDVSGVFRRSWRVTALELPGTPAGDSWHVVVDVEYPSSRGEPTTITHEAIRRDRPLRL